MRLQAIVIGCRQIILGGATWLWSCRIQILNGVKRAALGVLFFLLLFFVLATFIVTTPRDVAYRNLHPATRICKEGLETGWTILSEVKPKKAASLDNDDELVDPSNDESYAVVKDPIWAKRLRCSLQRHIIPKPEATDTTKKGIEYYLGFLEYKENGEPYSLIQDKDNGDEPTFADFLKRLIREGSANPPTEQLDVLRRHLRTGSNYVIAFAHGWRHDASIGDSNLADLRLYAAHAARFLAQRCELEHLYCDTRVTAIYIGWRGARVNERFWEEYLGPIGSFLAEAAAGTTLFDRKPVSEQVAPSAISALRAIDSDLSPINQSGESKPNWPINRMIVFGHSLGGNLLATGLQDDLIKAVRRHKPGDNIPPVLGDLVVLINPAAEASKWTAVQREVWDKIAFHVDQNTTLDAVIEGHTFFPIEQRPVIISVTSALEFPAGGLREADCTWTAVHRDIRYNDDRQSYMDELDKSEGIFKQGVEYDQATHDLFPVFKFDFRPLADLLDREDSRCNPQPLPWYRWPIRVTEHGLASLLRTFPFQNTNIEFSHTIGNLDPPRPAVGSPGQTLTSAAPFGTTHEIVGLEKQSQGKKYNAYYTVPYAPIPCSPANYWLQRARNFTPNGTFWDSEKLAAALPAPMIEGSPAARLVHGFSLSGIAPITRAADPFWNMRAFDNVLSKHDGYRLSSFICAMNQLVMDDITMQKLNISNKTADPNQTASTPKQN
jgi:hypothetical protein